MGAVAPGNPLPLCCLYDVAPSPWPSVPFPAQAPTVDAHLPPTYLTYLTYLEIAPARLESLPCKVLVLIQFPTPRAARDERF